MLSNFKTIDMDYAEAIEQLFEHFNPTNELPLHKTFEVIKDYCQECGCLLDEENTELDDNDFRKKCYWTE